MTKQYDIIIKSGEAEGCIPYEPYDDGKTRILFAGGEYTVEQAQHMINVLNTFVSGKPTGCATIEKEYETATIDLMSVAVECLMREIVVQHSHPFKALSRVAGEKGVVSDDLADAFIAKYPGILGSYGEEAPAGELFLRKAKVVIKARHQRNASASASPSKKRKCGREILKTC